VRALRASILLAGPLLARFGSVQLPPPGGDVIGRRRVDTHFLALEQLGAELVVGDRYESEAKRLTGADIFLDEPASRAPRTRSWPPSWPRDARCSQCRE
jgi:UDP-N-acetylglucosamine 1-carboxyvinyltransferase